MGVVNEMDTTDEDGMVSKRQPVGALWWVRGIWLVTTLLVGTAWATEPAADGEVAAKRAEGDLQSSIVSIRMRGPGLASSWGVILDADSVLVSLAPFAVPGRRFGVVTSDGQEREAWVETTLPELDLAVLALDEPIPNRVPIEDASLPGLGAQVVIPYSASYRANASASMIFEPALVSAATWAALGLSAVRASAVGLPAMDRNGHLVGVVVETSDRFHRVATVKALRKMLEARSGYRRRQPRFEPGVDVALGLPGGGGLFQSAATDALPGSLVLTHLRVGVTGPIGPIRLWTFLRGMGALGGLQGQPTRFDTTIAGTIAIGPDIEVPTGKLAIRIGGGVSFNSGVELGTNATDSRFGPWIEAGTELTAGPLIIGLNYGTALGPSRRGGWLLLE